MNFHALLRACDEAKYLGGDLSAALEDLRAAVHEAPGEAWHLKLEGCERTIKRHLEYMQFVQT
jgi:hypothetical protein